MPKIWRKKPAPDGFQEIEPTIREIERKIIEAERESHEGALWRIFKMHHLKSKYIYDLFYKEKAISRELFEYCVSEKIADKNLMTKWKRPGYEKLCCLQCIQTGDTIYGTTCICRVPKAQLEKDRIVECINCGCRGCSG